MKRSHRELRVWKAAIALVREIYQSTSRFPKEEIYGLTSQMRRAAISVPANIAEGAARAGSKELARFLSIASGSLAELDTLLEVSKELGFVRESTDLQSRIDEVSALVLALTKSIKNRGAS